MNDKLELRKSLKNTENAEQKKKVEQQLMEYSSDEDEEGLTVASRVGYIEMQVKKDRKAVYCVLIGGSFYYYKGSTDTEPKGSIDLVNHKIVFPLENAKKKYSFAIQKGEEQVFQGSCAGEAEVKAWVEALNGSLNKERADPPAVSVQKTKKQGVMKRAQKKAASGAAASPIGKKVIKAIVNEETTGLILALKHCVKTYTGSQKISDDLEKNIIKIAVKAFLLLENKQLNIEDFMVADKPIREAFELMVKVFNSKGRVPQEKITTALLQVEELLRRAEEVTTNLLMKHMTGKTMLKIGAVYGCIADAKFLEMAFNEQSLEGELEKLVDAMEYYTQFHYH